MEFFKIINNKLPDKHLVSGQCRGNATDAVRRLREQHYIGECQIATLSLLLAAATEKQGDAWTAMGCCSSTFCT
jgi:hypothetical protein